MIRTDGTGQPLISLVRSDALSRAVVPGSAVRVDVLGTQTGRGMLVRIAGHVFTAAGLAGHRAGESFRARVRISGDTVFLHPLPADASVHIPGIFDRLGLEENANTAFLVSFYQKIGLRLDARIINSLVRFASRFPGKEQRAAEAAAILSERGIEPTFDTIERLVLCIEGQSCTDDSSGAEGGANDKSDTERDFLTFINRKKGSDRHWIVLPFRKEIAGQSCSGSVRFLLDIPSHACIETGITCMADKIEWEFELSATSCRFTANPPFKSVVFDKFVVYLKSIFIAVGISDVSWQYPDGMRPPVAGPVDMEI